MRHLAFLAVSIVLVVSVNWGQAPREFTGKLDPQLAPDMVHVYKRVYAPVEKLAASQVEAQPPAGSKVAVGALIDIRSSSSKSIMFLVDPPTGPPFLWVDGNGNGIFETAEQMPMSPVAGTNQYSLVLRLPIKNAFFKDYPIWVRYFRGLSDPNLSPGQRLIEQTAYALAYGRVRVGEQNVLFQYPFAPSAPAISTNEGLYGVDVDGNGHIRDEQFSVETQYASAEEPVFPIGNIYVSTHMIDMATGNIVVRQRERSEYTRTDLEVEREMPDFAFFDMAGKERKLSDLRGKYVLVDFWGVWCGDCTRETPFQLEAYERFKKRGFEILGGDSDEKIETLRGYLAKNKITWPQATNDSTKQLREVTYRLQEYPSTVLLAPDGKVLVLNQRLLQGYALLDTLERTLPK